MDSRTHEQVVRYAIEPSLSSLLVISLGTVHRGGRTAYIALINTFTFNKKISLNTHEMCLDAGEITRD